VKKSDALAQQAARRLRQWHPIDSDRTSGRRDQSGEHPHRGRFAGAVRAEKSHDLRARDVECHLVDGHARTETAGQTKRRDHAHMLLGQVGLGLGRVG
jgi:hypothetical protein